MSLLTLVLLIVCPSLLLLVVVVVLSVLLLGRRHEGHEPVDDLHEDGDVELPRQDAAVGLRRV